MHMTRHAEHRRIQRNIPTDVVEAIYAFGRPRHALGAVSFTFDRNAIIHAADGDSRVAKMLERYVNAYLIVGDNGRIVTVARSERRFRNR